MLLYALYNCNNSNPFIRFISVFQRVLFRVTCFHSGKKSCKDLFHSLLSLHREQLFIQTSELLLLRIYYFKWFRGITVAFLLSVSLDPDLLDVIMPVRKKGEICNNNLHNEILCICPVLKWHCHFLYLTLQCSFNNAEVGVTQYL